LATSRFPAYLAIYRQRASRSCGFTPSPLGTIMGPNKIQFNGVDGLRTYINLTRIGDQPSH
jgi:hypothetical protein